MSGMPVEALSVARPRDTVAATVVTPTTAHTSTAEMSPERAEVGCVI
jgi:hypothetical protein